MAIEKLGEMLAGLGREIDSVTIFAPLTKSPEGPMSGPGGLYEMVNLYKMRNPGDWQCLRGPETEDGAECTGLVRDDENMGKTFRYPSKKKLKRWEEKMASEKSPKLEEMFTTGNPPEVIVKP